LGQATMTDFQRFVVVWAGSTGLMFIGLMLIAGLVVVSDRVVVFVLRAFGIRRFYRTAMQIAAIIRKRSRWVAVGAIPRHAQGDRHNQFARRPQGRDTTRHVGA
jgi:hypothetical protein